MHSLNTIIKLIKITNECKWALFLINVELNKIQVQFKICYMLIGHDANWMLIMKTLILMRPEIII